MEADRESTEMNVGAGDRHFDTTYTPVRDGDTIVGVIGVAVDASERHRVHQELAESVRSKDQFVATVSHELRTPITAVVGFAHELRNRIDRLAPEEIAQFVDMIRDQAVEVGGLVEDLDTQRYITRSGLEHSATIWKGAVAALVDATLDSLQGKTEPAAG